MKRRSHWNVYFFLIMLLLIYLLRSGTFIVYEGEQVVVTMFGKLFSRAYTEAGIYFRAPLIHRTRYFEKRIMTLMIYEKDVPTKDRYLINVTAAVHWRISDVVKFISEIDNEDNNARAELHLANMAASTIRFVIAEHKLIEIVRSTNYLRHKLDLYDVTTDEDLSPEDLEIRMNGSNEMITTPIYYGRAFLVRKMTDEIALRANEFGMDIVNVVLTDLNYNEWVKDGVYRRMRLEREAIAEELRSEGDSKIQEVNGIISTKYNEIIAPAKNAAEKIKGKGDAEALVTYAKEYKKDLKFYNFWRTIEAYKETFPNMEKSVLSSKSDFLKVLQERPVSPKDDVSSKDDKSPP
ncbi:MAG: protease modulator HflC [Oligoflexia bacterium]|nr:protease modulator HflC [Oligoflexia bacterium]